MLDSEPIKYRIKLAKKFYPVFQRNKEGEPWEGDVKTIDELRKLDNKRKLYKQYHRIRID